MILSIIFCVLPIIGTPLIHAAPTTETLVTVSDSLNPVQNDRKAESAITDLQKPELYSMKVYSQINTRYATTLVSSRVANPANKSQEVVFSIVIPETAFISEFIMELEGKVYKAYVKKKEEAKQIYDNAVASGFGAAHVEMSARDSNKFTVSVNVEPRSKALFNLTYEELLTRRLGVYNLVLNLHPGQIVRDMSVDVDILEAQKISTLRIPTLRTGNEIDPDETTAQNEIALKSYLTPSHVHIKFSPTPDQQKELIKQLEDKTDNGFEGVSGQFVVQYDVERDPQSGEVVVYDGYFVHFFAPKGLTPLNKHVIFVLDVSGSMMGTKIAQLKEAMNTILDDLRPGDYFNLVDFSYEAQVYDLNNITKSNNQRLWFSSRSEPKQIQLIPPYQANKDNIAKAKNVIKQLEAIGGTNIEGALKLALELAKLTPKSEPQSSNKTEEITTDKPVISNPEPLIMFLTDGDPTVGETSTTKILKMVKELNNQYAIFALAFGDDADRGFLKQLAIRNSGFMRHIYEANDAATQLQQFYKQIASPLLRNITFKYPDNQVEDLTNHDCHILFGGSEFVTAGKLVSSDLLPQPSIRLESAQGQPLDFITKVLTAPMDSKSKPSLQRLWAFLKIKQLIDQKYAYIDAEEGVVLSETTTVSPGKSETNLSSIENEIVKLALKYSFVTKLTSLVVVKPNSTTDVTAETLPVPSINTQQYPSLALALNNVPPSTFNLRPMTFNSYSAFYPQPTSSGYFASPARYKPSHMSTVGHYMPSIYNHRVAFDSYADYVDSSFETSTPSLVSKYGLDQNTFDWLDLYDNYVKLDGRKYLKTPFSNTTFGVCNNSANGTGVCKLVTECPEKNRLISEAEYRKYSCTGILGGDSYFTMCCNVPGG